MVEGVLRLRGIMKSLWDLLHLRYPENSWLYGSLALWESWGFRMDTGEVVLFNENMFRVMSRGSRIEPEEA